MRVCDYLHAMGKNMVDMAKELEMDYRYTMQICAGRARPSAKTMRQVLNYCRGYVSEDEIKTQKSATYHIDETTKRIIL